MRKILVFTFICLLLSFMLQAKAVLKFESQEINFGKIDEGKSVNLAFKFKNTGDSVLYIKSIRPSCGCTVTRLEKKKYKPGEKGTIPVKFISNGFGGRRIMKSIGVTSNDDKNPYIRLKIIGLVTLKNFARIEVSPSSIDFKKIPLGKQKSRKLIIKNTGNLDLKILEVSHIPEIIPMFSDTVIKPNQSAVVEIILKAKTEVKAIHFLKIRSNDHRQYYTLVKIECQVTR
ncbi:MAG: DUF1573 domain-containing protein [Candidatus Aminicenantes bacterium]|nr:DUF1573 domain-containing protein [Candidatus Aminicenantes bacterium]